MLEADGIGRSFRGRDVLTSAGFSARRGTITALLGRNGAGKSTLLRIAVGRVRPDYGRILWRGAYVPPPRLARLAANGLMYLAQEASLTRLFTIREHLAAYARVFGAQHRREAVVSALGLEELPDHCPARVSGGERQRASLALARGRPAARSLPHRRGRTSPDQTASVIFGVPLPEVTADQRSTHRNDQLRHASRAGRVLARQLGIPRGGAAFIGHYFERFSGVRHYLDEQVEKARTLGCVETLLGRRLYVPEVR
jgi:ABC-type transport system involved in cytochrome c biogenesis ATPase subunit